jgi:ADP-heptose:LPS heptosyltransferase
LARKPESLQRILLVRNDRIGDLVLTLPAMQAARQAWPDAHIALLASAYAGPLLRGSEYIDDVLLDDPAHSASQLGSRLAPMRFDTALVFNTNTRNCLAVWKAGVKRRVFWAYKPAGLLLGNRRVALHRNHPPIHEAAFALAFVRKLGVDAGLTKLAPKLPIDAAVKQRVQARILADLGAEGPLFGVHPGDGRSAYNWPVSCYARLVRELAEHGRVAVSGSQSEGALLDAIRRDLDGRLAKRVAFYTDLELVELAALVAMEDVLTVGSTGPMHLAGILNTSVVALFSPHPAHSPKKWAPLGYNHTILMPRLDTGEDPRVAPQRAADVMARIPLEKVLEANLQSARLSKTSRPADQNDLPRAA